MKNCLAAVVVLSQPASKRRVNVLLYFLFHIDDSATGRLLSASFAVLNRRKTGLELALHQHLKLNGTCRIEESATLHNILVLR